jgi:hypothetical protein
MKGTIDEKTLYAGEQIDKMLGRLFFNFGTVIGESGGCYPLEMRPSWRPYSGIFP